jgi:hypothetical protein
MQHAQIPKSTKPQAAAYAMEDSTGQLQVELPCQGGEFQILRNEDRLETDLLLTSQIFSVFSCLLIRGDSHFLATSNVKLAALQDWTQMFAPKGRLAPAREVGQGASPLRLLQRTAAIPSLSCS